MTSQGFVTHLIPCWCTFRSYLSLNEVEGKLFFLLMADITPSKAYSHS